MTGNTVDELDAMLAKGRRNDGPCKFVRATEPEQRATIGERVAKGLRGWTTYQRWLEQQGVIISTFAIQTHFVQGHADDR